MAVIHQQLLPSPTTPPRARIFVDCLEKLKIHCGISPSKDLGVCCLPKRRTSKWAQLFQLVLRNFFLRAKFLLETTNLMWLSCSNRTNDQLLNYYSKDPLCCSKDVLICSSWGVFFEGICLPGTFFCREKRRLWSHHPCGKLWWGCLCVHALWKKQMWCTSGCLEVEGPFPCSGWSQLFGMRVALDPWSWRNYFTPLWACWTWNGNRNAQFCILGMPTVPREAKPWVGPATYWLFPDLVEELGSPNLWNQAGWAASNQIIAPKAESHHQQRQIEGFNSSSFALIREIEK